MIKPSPFIGRSCNNRPITGRLLASVVFTIGVTLCLPGCFHVTVDCARIKDESTNVLPEDASVIHSQSLSPSFNCPTDWKGYKDKCFKWIETELVWDEAHNVCQSYGGVLADLQNGVEWEWLDSFITSQYSGPTRRSDTTHHNSSVAESEGCIHLWAGIQRFPNGTYLWSDGLRNLVLNKAVWKDQQLDTDGTRKCVEISVASEPSKKASQWRVTDCDQRNPFVCKVEACSGTMVHCPREATCVPPSWMCDGHVDCRSARDETLCSKAKAKDSQDITYCGETFKSDQGSFTSPNHPSNYPPLSHCLWTIETDPDKVLLITIYRVDIEDGHDTLVIYDGVKLKPGSNVTELFSTNDSKLIRTKGNLATVQFLSDATNHNKGFNISWRSDHKYRQSSCGNQRVFVTSVPSTVDFDASDIETTNCTNGVTILCDWIFTSTSTIHRVSLHISSLKLEVGESLKVFDGSDLDNDNLLIKYSHAQHGTHIALGSRRNYSDSISKYIAPSSSSSSFVSAIMVSYKSTLRLQIKIRSGSSAHVKLNYYLGCHHSISTNPVIVMSPGFSMSRYPNNLNCSWNFHQESASSGNETTLLLFPGFSTEGDKDVLKIFDDSTHIQAAISKPVEFSGRIDKSHPISFTSSFTVQFTSDSTVNRGQWIAVVSSDKCNQPPISNGLTVRLDNTTFGSHVTFSCQDGYTLVGHDTAFCGVFGRWSPNGAPICSETSCGSPPIPRDGYLVSLSGLTYGSVALVQCHNGFRLHGNQSSICGSNGWSETPTCQEILCPKELPPDGGNAKAEELRFGSLREYFCKPPQRLVGIKFSHCNESGLWTDEVPSCQPLTCPFPPRLLHGRFSTTGAVLVDQSIDVLCDDGFVVEGPKSITCRKDLGFGDQLPKCIDVNECSNADQNCGPHHCQNSHGKYHCMCGPGFRHPHSNTSTECEDINDCDASNGGCSDVCVNTPGSYSCHCPHPFVLYNGQETHVGNHTLVPFHTCIATCPPIMVPGNGQAVFKERMLDSGRYLEGTQAVLKCPSEWYLDGQALVTCNVNGSWTPLGSTCKEYKCETPPEIPNGRVLVGDLVAGSEATYSCRPGFTLKGPHRRFCLPKRFENQRREYTWSGLPPTCEIVSCPPLSDPTHGKVYVSSLSYKAMAVFQCECGYTLTGKTAVECTAHGNWSDASPFCEVESCKHPSIPQHSVISHNTPGFPVWSAVKYQCLTQGYQMKGPSVIVCQSANSKKLSNVKPMYQITLQMSFVVEEGTVHADGCLLTHSKSLAIPTEIILNNYIQKHCSGMDVRAFHLDTFEVHSHQLITTQTNLSLASDNTTATYVCGDTLTSMLNVISPELENIWIEQLTSSSSRCSNTLFRSANTSIIKGGDWRCWDGLIMEERDGQFVCLEGCIKKTETIDDIINSLAQGGNDTVSEFHSLDAGPDENDVFGEFQYPVHTPDEPTTTMSPNTKPSSTSHTFIQDNTFMFKLTKSMPLQTDETTKIPAFTTSSRSQSELIISTTSERPTTRKRNSFTHILMSNLFKGREDPGLTVDPPTSPSSTANDPFDLDSKKDRKYFAVDDNNFPTRITGVPNENNQLLLGQRPKSNCSVSRLQRGMEEFLRSKMNSSAPLLPGRVSDVVGGGCEEDQMLEKQETKLVHAPTAPSSNLSSPLYTVEVRDKLTGSFFNISCVDAVHMIVNAKVNEILQQFGQQHTNGHVCREAPDAALELVAGNIRFKGNTARVYIKFAITHNTSPKSNVVDCGMEFESFVKVQLPKVLARFLPLVLRVNCAFINYTALEFTVAHKGWTCRRGYTLDSTQIECSPTPLNSSVFEIDGRQNIDFVNSLPRLKMNFNGVFNVLGHERPARSTCVSEYNTGISVALSKMEPHLQGRFFQCSNLYLQPSKNVSVLVTGKRIIAKASIDLVPLKSSIDLASMTKCSRFLSLHFREPSHFLSTVTLGQSYLPSCPPIRLMPHGIRANLHFIYYCPEGFYYEAENFKCIHELLPMYSSGWDLKIEGSLDASGCKNSVKKSAIQMVRSLLTEIRQRINYKHICNATTGVILIPKEGHFETSLFTTSIKMVVSITSLTGITSDVQSCMADIHSRLNSMMIGPQTAMMQKVAPRCQSDHVTISRHPRLTHTRWECRQNLVYNSVSGRCEPIRPRFLMKVPAPYITIMKGIKSTRFKRSPKPDRNSIHQPATPIWSEAPPSCIDVMPPEFLDCPQNEVVIVLGRMGTRHLNIPLPTPVDNSGLPPRVTFEPPDFTLPYKFSQNMSLDIIAIDPSGNRAVCNMTIAVLDHIPPVITCPTEPVRIPVPSPSQPQDISFFGRVLSGVAQAWDNSGHVTVTYDVIGDVIKTALSSSNGILVKATAEDLNLNTASCSLFVVLVANSCSVSNLPNPVGGFKKCVETGGDPGGVTCSVSCGSGKAFAARPPLQYICAHSNRDWVPNDRVPNCYDTYLPDIEISYKFNISFRDTSIPECVKTAVLSVKTSIKSIFLPLCGTSTVEKLNFTVYTRHSFFQYSPSNMISSSIQVLIHDPFHERSTQPKPPLAVVCGNRGVIELGEWINSSLRRHCLGRDIAPVFNIPRKNITCAAGWALVNALCVECPAGTYWSALKCLECPVGSYQTIPGKTSCVPCADGLSTRVPGAKGEQECHAVCQTNSYSPDGLGPCVPCPLGMYQHKPGASRCTDCTNDNGTTLSSCKEPCVPRLGGIISLYQHNPGSTRCMDCGHIDENTLSTFQEVCSPGTYSLTGNKPCYPCPLNAYNMGHGMTHCRLCPDGFITETEGTDHLALCLEHDPCKTSPCLNGGRCNRIGRQVVCNCGIGYTGVNCESTIKACQSSPCANGGTCLQDGSSFNCSCLNGYRGNQCETMVDFCNPNPCIHGLCVNNDTTYSCQCTPGFEGPECDVNVDDCKDVTCLNGGICEDLVEDFICRCKPGFTGTMCESNIDDCATSGVCLQGGSCVDGIDSFSCLCPEGFSGKYCEISFNECDIGPCKNGGICGNNIDSSYACTCPVGYTGKQCQDQTDFCASSPCWNNGQCTTIHNTSLPTFVCSCLHGFTGVLCQRGLNFCSPTSCSLEGTERCENGPSAHVCICRDGWTGESCNQRLDSCEKQECLNGGRCINHDGHHASCQCQPDFTGLFCEELIDRCLPTPCHNGGRCVLDQGLESSCLCAKGFTGVLCQENIDECGSDPCQNGGTCFDGVNSFVCRCTKEYAGPTCQISLDACLSQPCQGKQLCEKRLGEFHCYCPPGTTGKNCETGVINLCDPNPCHNGGKCMELKDGFQCECRDGFSGDACLVYGGQGDIGSGEWLPCLDRGQSTNFDMKFSDSNTMCHIDQIQVWNVTELTMCFWVQIMGSDVTVSFLKLELSAADLNETQTTIALSGKAVEMMTSERDNSVSLVNDDGFWHHVCIVLGSDSWTIYNDGNVVDEEQNSDTLQLSNVQRLQLQLGRPRSTEDKDEDLTVSITDLNLYGRSFREEEVKRLAKKNSSCNVQVDIFDWENAKVCSESDVDIVEPSARMLDPTKSLNSAGTKRPPEMSFCPDDIHVVSQDSPVAVTWEEPLFDYVSEIVSINQNVHSGQAFPYGHHVASYVAMDSLGNMASCSFHIFISRFTCMDPPPPTNGARVCGEWHHGRYCIASCLTHFSFVSPVPPFYLCGKEGVWNPPGDRPFLFPVCARAVPPILIVYGLLDLEGPACSREFIQQLQTRMTTILTQVDDAVGLCGSTKKGDRVCNYTHSLHAECGEKRNVENAQEDGRVKRDVENKGIYSVRLTITLNNHQRKTGSPNQHSEWILDDFVASVKNSTWMEEFHLSHVDVTVEDKCQKGSVTINDSFGQYKCVECPTDHEISGRLTCDPCPSGWYNDKPGEQTCQPCPQQRSPSASEKCQEKCSVGSYLDPVSRHCSPCAKGLYQDEIGKTGCKSCPMGYFTLEDGSTDANDCIDTCTNGKELGAHGDCVSCPVGWYKNRTLSPNCLPCPYAWTTLNVGAVSVLECALKNCKQGHFLDVETGQCLPCPLGTFKANSLSQPGTSRCQPCGVGLTTPRVGANRASACVAGRVDECVLGIHDCPEHTTCVDVEDGLFTCRCNFGIDVHGACKKATTEMDPCEKTKLTPRDEERPVASSVDSTCKCGQHGCQTVNIEKDYHTFLESLAVYSMTTTLAATLLVLIIIAIVVYRRQRRQARTDNHVRLYRREEKAVVSAFQNKAFDVNPVTPPVSVINCHSAFKNNTFDNVCPATPSISVISGRSTSDTLSTIPSSAGGCVPDAARGEGRSRRLCYTDSFIGFDLLGDGESHSNYC